MFYELGMKLALGHLGGASLRSLHGAAPQGRLPQARQDERECFSGSMTSNSALVPEPVRAPPSGPAGLSLASRTHAEQLGALLSGLQALEFSIRLYLSQLPEASDRGVFSDDFGDMPAGTRVPASVIVDCEGFRQLVHRFNALSRESGWSTIDTGLAELRDALTHGSIFAGPDDGRFRIVRFEHPDGDGARISYNEVMSEAWFAENTRRVREATGLVMGKIGA